MNSISRSQFLKRASILSAGGMFSLGSHHLFGKSANRKDKLGVALVGLGYYSRDLLAPALQLTQHCELRGIVTGTPSKIPVWQQRYGIPDANVYNYATMPELVNNDDIDIVYIVLPTSMHAEYSIIAANAGKHVFCEKPMSMNVVECQSIIDACEQNGVFLSIGYRLQHEKNTSLIAGYAKQGRYGTFRSAVARAGYFSTPRDPENWKMKAAMGGGALYDMGVYPINALRYASAKEPVAVRGKMGTVRPQIFTEVDETSTFEFRFDDGSMAEGATSVGQNMNFLRSEFENGWFELQPFQSYAGVSGSTSDGQQLTAMEQNQQALQMDNDALAIKEGRSATVPGEEGLRDIRIVNAIMESSKNDGVWVDLT